MIGPRHSHVSFSSCWRDAAERTTRRHSAAEGASTLDVAVVGGGLTGLSVAFHLKNERPARRVAVFEAHRVGCGATGRSGGILAEHPAMIGSSEDVEFLRRFVAASGIDCDWRSRARDPLVPHEFPHDLLDPWKLCLALERLCTAAGVRIYEDSPVENCQADAHVLTGPPFSAVAERIIFATDAFICPWQPINALLGRLRQACLVVECSAEARALPWTYYRETGDGAHYWGRRIGETRFLFGGREFDSAASGAVAPTWEHVVSESDRLLPGLKGSSCTHFWHGDIGRFHDGLRRRIVAANGLLYVGGYNGDGIAAAVRAGMIVSRLCADGTACPTFPLFTFGSDGRLYRCDEPVDAIRALR